LRALTMRRPNAAYIGARRRGQPSGRPDLACQRHRRGRRRLQIPQSCRKKLPHRTISSCRFGNLQRVRHADFWTKATLDQQVPSVLRSEVAIEGAAGRCDFRNRTLARLVESADDGLCCGAPHDG
jgi:hypothetical protein